MLQLRNYMVVTFTYRVLETEDYKYVYSANSIKYLYNNLFSRYKEHRIKLYINYFNAIYTTLPRKTH